MLRIPFEGPSLVNRRVVASTPGGLHRGIVRALGPEGLDLVEEGPDGRSRLRHFRIDEVLVIAPA